MKNRLLLAFLFGTATLGMNAQTSKEDYTITGDLTSSKIQNADFSQGTPVTANIATYDYNMPDAGAGAEGEALFGMQPVPGWTASAPSDNIKVMQSSSDPAREDGANAKASGIFTHADESTGENGFVLGGGSSDTYFAPYADAQSTGNLLGMVAVWSAELSYTQDVTLPAGAYMIVVKYQNVAGSGSITSKMGFIANDGTSYLSTATSYPVGTSWQEDVIAFRIKSETSGKISLGYKSGNIGSGSAPHIFIDDVKLYQLDASQFDAAEVAAAKEELLDVINEGKEYGADVTDAMAVYNDANATLEQVKAAIEAQKEINANSTTDLSEAFITNPHFSLDEPVEGGICTYDYDCEKNSIPLTNFSMLDVKGWTQNKKDNGAACGVYAIGSDAFLGGADFLPPTTMSDGSTEGRVLGFVTCWTMTAQYTQSTTLPKGKYTLGISYYNAGGSSAIVKNLIGFVAKDGTEYLAKNVTFPVGQWSTESITFELEEQTTGYFTLGYTAANAGSASMPHFFIDGFSLYYVGDADPSFLALQSAVVTGTGMLEEKFNADLISQLEKAVQNGKALVDANSSDADANKAATEAITDLFEEVNASIEAYEKLGEFINGALAKALDTYDEVTYPDLYNQLADLDDELQPAYRRGTYTTEQIEEAIASLDGMIKPGVQKAWDAAVASGEGLANGLDISILFDQLAYTYSTTAQSGANVPDKEWQYGDATNFKTQYGTAEVWNQSPFKVSRTIQNLPAGTYTITTKAFYRYSDQATNYDTYIASPEDIPGAYVFAGSNKTALANVAELATDQADAFPSTSAVGDGLVVPNSQEAAYQVFENDDYTETVEKSVSTVLAEAGDLTFGVSADAMEGNNWVVWYSFSISYNAVDDAVLNEELQNLVEEVNEFMEENSELLNTKAASDTQDAVDAAEEAIDGSTTDMSEALSTLKAAYATAQENLKLMNELIAAQENLDLVVADYYEDASSDAQNAYNDILDELDEEALGDLTNEEISALIEKVNGVAAALKVPSAADEASDNNPVDLTILIQTPSFEKDGTNSAEGWQGANGNFGNNDTQKGALAYEFYNKQIDLYQDINVPNGTYELTVSAFYRPDASSTAAEDAQIYATSGEATSSVLITYRDTEYSETALATGETELTTGTGEATVVYGYVPNDMVSAAAYFTEGYYENTLIFKVTDGKVRIGVKKTANKGTDWVIMDNFRLTYFGENSEKEAADDLTGIETAEAADAAPAAIYTITGVKVAQLQKGLNIVIDQNGNAKKIYKK